MREAGHEEESGEEFQAHLHTEVFLASLLGFRMLARVNLIHLLPACLQFPSHFPLSPATSWLAHFPGLVCFWVSMTNAPLYLFVLPSPLPRRLMGTERGE